MGFGGHVMHYEYNEHFNYFNLQPNLFGGLMHAKIVQKQQQDMPITINEHEKSY